MFAKPPAFDKQKNCLIFAPKRTHSHIFMKDKFRQFAAFVSGLAVIFGLFYACRFACAELGVKFPASLTAMIALFGLLSLKIVPLWTVEKTCEFLMRYMVFFFLPLLVMLPIIYGAFRDRVWSILAALAVSAFLTMGATAAAVECVHKIRLAAQKRAGKSEESQ